MTACLSGNTLTELVLAWVVSHSAQLSLAIPQCTVLAVTRSSHSTSNPASTGMSSQPLSSTQPSHPSMHSLSGNTLLSANVVTLHLTQLVLPWVASHSAQLWILVFCIFVLVVNVCSCSVVLMFSTKPRASSLEQFASQPSWHYWYFTVQTFPEIALL